ncbi:MAG: hypothetical protein RSC92_00005 [Clostridia bacterium]
MKNIMLNKKVINGLTVERKNKLTKGISLIVLVITIIIIIILAGAIIFNIFTNNIISRASTATFMNDMKNIIEKQSIIYNSEYANKLGNKELIYDDIFKNIVPEKYIGKIIVDKNGVFEMYNSGFSIIQKDILKELNIENIKEIKNSNILSLSNSKGLLLDRLEINGRSIQNGIPTLDDPKDIQNLDNIDLTVCGKNIFKVGTINDYYNWNFNIFDNKIVGKNASSSNAFITNKMFYPYTSNTSFTFSYNVTAGGRTYVSFYDENKNNITSSINISGLTYNPYYGGGGLYNTNNILTVSTENKDVKYLRFGFATYDDTIPVNTDITITNIQLEIGNDVTLYEPYKEIKINLPYKLRSIGNNVIDKLVIDKSQKKAWIERNVGYKKIEASSFNEYGGSYNSTSTCYHSNNTGDRKPESIYYMSTHFKNLSDNIIKSNFFEEGIWLHYNVIYPNNGYIRINNNRLSLSSTKEERESNVSKYISNFNSYIQYELSSPQMEKIQYIDIPTYSGVTTILHNGLESNMFCEYR